MAITRRQIEGHWLAARLKHPRFVIAFLPAVKAKKMHFVVACHALAGRAVDQGAVENPDRLLIVWPGCQRYGAADNPQLKIARALA